MNTTTVISITVPHELKARLDKELGKRNLSRSGFIAELIETALKYTKPATLHETQNVLPIVASLSGAEPDQSQADPH